MILDLSNNTLTHHLSLNMTWAEIKWKLFIGYNDDFELKRENLLELLNFKRRMKNGMNVECLENKHQIQVGSLEKQWLTIDLYSHLFSSACH